MFEAVDDDDFTFSAIELQVVTNSQPDAGTELTLTLALTVTLTLTLTLALTRTLALTLTLTLTRGGIELPVAAVLARLQAAAVVAA